MVVLVTMSILLSDMTSLATMCGTTSSIIIWFDLYILELHVDELSD